MGLKDVHFITGNKNKLAEVSAILEGTVNLRSTALDLIEIQGSMEDIARDKCRRAADAINGPVLVEDVGLCLNALNGLPGPYIKWFLNTLGHQGLMNLLAAYEDKSAQAICTVAYSDGPGHEPVILQGKTDGQLVLPRGPTNFGFDCMFEYEGKTFAEMDKAVKNRISHRFVALEKFKAWLETQS